MIRAAQSVGEPGMGARVPGLAVVSTDAHADLPRKERINGKKLQEFIWRQYEDGLPVRRYHARMWRMVESIMHEKHHFSMSGGQLRQLAPDRTGRKPRAVAPIMKPHYRLEEGRLSGNQLGVSVKARLGDNPHRFQRALSGQATMEDWIERSEAQEVFIEANRQLLYYGGSWLHPWVNPLDGQVRVEPVAAPQIMPIPYDVHSFREADGIMRIQFQTQQWLEMEDDRYGRLTGKKDFKRMARAVNSQGTAMGDDLVGLTGGGPVTGRVEGALVISFWIRPNENNEAGQFGFMVNDTLFRYTSEYDEKGFSTAMLNGRHRGHDRGYAPGRIPLEPMGYIKLSDDFYPYGFCENMVALQRETNRQLGALVTSAVRNKPLIGYDPLAIDSKDILDEASMLIPVKRTSDDGKPPLWHFPAQTVGRDVGAVLQVVNHLARQAVNHESAILTGQQEGRTEGGPATELLNANAQAPLQTVLDGIRRAWGIVLREVLDLTKRNWPSEPRAVRTAGRLNLGRELMLKETDIPWSDDVEVSPTPMLPGGRNAMVQLLFALRQMPADDGKGFELKSEELRRALALLAVAPPGMEMADPVEERINDRIALLINDTQKPAIPSAMDDLGQQKIQAIENHPLAIKLLKRKLLDPSYRHYSPEVQKALWDEFEFHAQCHQGTNPERFDDDLEAKGDMDGENFLRAQEDDLSTFEGDVTADGMAIGVG